MWLPRRLRDALETLQSAQNLTADVHRLQAAVEALEALQLKRELEWAEAKDQLYRHLKRVQALKQHEDAREEAASSRPSQATVLAMKYPRTGG